MRAPASGLHVSVVMPVLNEAENLPMVLPALPPLVDELVLVNGHSSDATIVVARQLFPGVKVVVQTGKGKGDALRCGFAVASGDIVVMMDADGSNDPREIPRFVQALVAGADIAKGSRYLAEGGSSDLTALRWAGNHALNMLVNWLFQSHFTDLCYGYNAFWRDALDFFDVEARGFEVEAQIYLRARKANLKIVEVPSFERQRLHGTGHLRTFHDGWRVLRTIWAEWRERYSDIKTPGMHRLAQPRGATPAGEASAAAPRERIGASP